MASRYGAREPGTDGSDFKYRESVASQHTTSLAVKSRLKRYFIYNILFGVAQIVLYFISTFKLVKEADKLCPELWQGVVALSSIASFIGLASLQRNRAGLLKAHNAILVLLGIGGAILAFVSNYETITELWMGDPVDELFGIPKVLLVFNLAVLTLVLYMSTLFGTYTLLSVWNYRKTR